MPPLRVYTIDIVGSLFGIATFTLLVLPRHDAGGWSRSSPSWLTLQALGTGIRPFSAVSAAAIVAVIAHRDGPGRHLVAVPADHRPQGRRYGVDPRQRCAAPGLSLSPTRDQGSFYTQVDDWFPGRTFDNVLIIGAGSGNDTAVAIARGDSHIDAVEIDPAIQQIGVDLHPNHPYQDPRVTVTSTTAGPSFATEREVRPHRLRPAPTR